MRAIHPSSEKTPSRKLCFRLEGFSEIAGMKEGRGVKAPAQQAPLGGLDAS